MKLVVDASVAIKWAVDENDRAAARALMIDRNELVAPDFVLTEIANILWKKVRRGEIEREQAIAAVPGIKRVFARLLPTTMVLDRALELALELDHPVYDCLYLAAAELEATRVVTADRRFLDRLAQGRHANMAVALQDVS